MAGGNAPRRGAVRKQGTKKGMVVGSGGQRRRGLKGKKPTPKAEDRTGHPAARRAAARGSAAKAAGSGRRSERRTGQGSAADTVAGRNAVLEALRAKVPVKALYVAEHIDTDPRVRDVLKIAQAQNLPLLEAPRTELDRISGGAVHQGVVLTLPAYQYAHPDDILAAAREMGRPPLVVALDGITDPRNLGAVVRSAAAFGAHGVVIPERRSASITAGAWKSSAGTAAQLPIAKVNGLGRTLRSLQQAGLFVVGLAGSGPVEIGEVTVLDQPMCLVVGAEDAGLSRLVTQVCDVVARIPIAGTVESLNAGVAAGVALYEVARARREGAGGTG